MEARIATSMVALRALRGPTLESATPSPRVPTGPLTSLMGYGNVALVIMTAVLRDAARNGNRTFRRATCNALLSGQYPIVHRATF